MDTCEFFLIRYVPDPIKNEAVNIGLVMMETQGKSGQVAARFTRDLGRLQCVDARVDLDYVRALQHEINTKLGKPEDWNALLKTMRDSWGTTIQVSESYACPIDFFDEIDKLAKDYLEPAPAAISEPRAVTSRGGRAALRRSMLHHFQDAGVLPLFQLNLAVSKYSETHDSLVIDCGYSSESTIKMFHAVPLRTDPDYVKLLAFSYPRLANGIARMENTQARLTAVVENDLDRKSRPVVFAYEIFEESKIAIATMSEVPRLAEIARKELRL